MTNKNDKLLIQGLSTHALRGVSVGWKLDPPKTPRGIKWVREIERQRKRRNNAKKRRVQYQ